VYDDTSNEPVRVFDSGVMIPDPSTFGEYKLSYRTGDIVSPHISAEEPLSLELADFCRAIATGSTPESSVQLGVEVMKIIEAVDASLARTGSRVRVAGTRSATRGPVNAGARPAGKARRERDGRTLVTQGPAAAG